MPSAAVSAKKLLNINTFKFLIDKIITTSVFSYIKPILHLFSDIIIIFILNYNQKYYMIKKLKWIIIFLFLSIKKVSGTPKAPNSTPKVPSLSIKILE